MSRILVGDRDRAGFARAYHRQADVRAAVAHAVAVHLGKAVFDGGKLAKPHHLVATPLDDDVFELRRRHDAADQAYVLLVQHPLDLADRGRGVLVAARR